MDLFEILKNIEKPDEELMNRAQERLDKLTKPIGSLGKLEIIARTIVGITGEILPDITKKVVVIMCADNGVTDEGVSSCPKEVTATVTNNFLKGITGINILAKMAGSEICVVDIGVDADIDYKEILNKKIRRGTNNIAKGPAMSKDEALRSIISGVEVVKKLKEDGYKIIGIGEMGIGNTTTASTVCAVMTGNSPSEIVGRGAGLTTQALKNKIRVVEEAIKVNRPDASDPIDVLHKVGGFDIGGLVGCIIGAAYYKIPVVLDGIITYAAALLAISLNPFAKNYLIPSHGSNEPSTKIFMDSLELEPMLNLDMRLGEGSGAAIGFYLLDAAINTYKNMGTFGDAGIEEYVPLS